MSAEMIETERMLRKMSYIRLPGYYVIVICSWSSLHTPTQAGAGNQTFPQEPSYSRLIRLLYPSCSAPLLPVPSSTVIHMLLTEVKGLVSGGFQTDSFGLICQGFEILSLRVPPFNIMMVNWISLVLLTALEIFTVTFQKEPKVQLHRATSMYS